MCKVDFQLHHAKRWQRVYARMLILKSLFSLFEASWILYDVCSISKGSEETARLRNLAKALLTGRFCIERPSTSLQCASLKVSLRQRSSDLTVNNPKTYWLVASHTCEGTRITLTHLLFQVSRILKNKTIKIVFRRKSVNRTLTRCSKPFHTV